MRCKKHHQKLGNANEGKYIGRESGDVREEENNTKEHCVELRWYKLCRQCSSKSHKNANVEEIETMSEAMNVWRVVRYRAERTKGDRELCNAKNVMCAHLIKRA